MKRYSTLFCMAVMGFGCGLGTAFAQTEGTARFSVQLENYGSPRADHWTVVWVTTESGEFIKTLWKQGPRGWTSRHWDKHCQAWNQARGGTEGSQAIDGYTGATARNYSGTNSPVVVTWNGLDAENKLMPDANYKFWIQYAEDSGQGPYTTNGLLWAKSEVGKVTDYTWPTGSFTNLQVVWEPAPADPAPDAGEPDAAAEAIKPAPEEKAVEPSEST